MKSKYVIIILTLILGIGGVSYYFYTLNVPSKTDTSENLNNTGGFNISRTSSIENSSQNNNTTDAIKQSQKSSAEFDSSNNEKNTENSKKEEEQNASFEKKETEIASFSTKIYSKDNERQNNVSITCNSLNDTIVENGKTFSFCNTVGKATSGKGYQKADVFKDGEKIKALGGGNCQVSSTLYNAVLKIPELKVTERHAHSNDVPYVKKGKDAAVSYGTYDFKFVNNTRE